MSKYGFKEINVENWLQPDPVLAGIVRLSAANGYSPTPKTAEDWLGEVLYPQLDGNVPDEVASLFEVARGALAYGYLFYPLFTLGAEQVSRVVETAITRKYMDAGGPAKIPKSQKQKLMRPTFEDKINWLADNGIMKQADADLCHLLRGFRNRASHPEHQQIMWPRHAVIILARTAQVISALFS